MERKKPYVNEAVVLQKDNQKKRKKKYQHLLELAVLFLAFIFFIYLIPEYVMERIPVSGESMENTLYDGDHVLVEKISLKWGKIKRFDVIVFRMPGEEGFEYYIKRVIGLPGEKLRILDGTIYIDGQPLYESYGKTALIDAGQALEEVQIGEDEHFVLGDNREVSLDSRYEYIGMVRSEQIIGRAFFVLWPMKSMRVIQ